MGGSSWVALLGSLAMIALILTAFGLMLGIVKPANAPKHIGAILGLTITLMLLPGVFVSAWLGMSLWQQVALVAIGIGIGIWQWRRPRRQPRIKRRD
jgi:hypothetical protein